MRILQIFNSYTHIGGEEIAVSQISAKLSECHEFCDINFDSKVWAAEKGIFSRLRQLLFMVWNPIAIGKVREQIEAFRPDVILLHNIMPIGSAGLYVYLSRCGVPIVHYIHNFRPFSVNGYCWGNGKLLPQGLCKNFLPEIYAGAWQNSRIKTAWYAMIIWILHFAGVYKKMTGWIAISHFMKETFIKGGIEEKRIAVIPHSWYPLCSNEAAAPLSPNSEVTFLFLGRITEEKGVRVLLDAWEIFESKSQVGKLIFVGDGPMKDELMLRCKEMRNAHYLGFKSGDEKQQLLSSCNALVVPSIWWEPSGLVLYEAYDHGKPVIAAASGGIIDHVENGVTGWIHEPGNISMLAAHMLAASLDENLCCSMGANGRKFLFKRDAKLWIHEFNDFVGKIILEQDYYNQSSNSRQREGEDVRHRCINSSVFEISIYLADQNPGYDRSLGISRMSDVILSKMSEIEDLELKVVSSRTSQQPSQNGLGHRVLPWGTKSKLLRVLTDQLHPMLYWLSDPPDIWYFPKGYLPRFLLLKAPTVVTIHDTIIQYYWENYPGWRRNSEYSYWVEMLKSTIKKADGIFTVSQTAKRQIQDFMKQNNIPEKEIIVTYEPCIYESIAQPIDPTKGNTVVHLASCEPHKKTYELISWWSERAKEDSELPVLELIGNLSSKSEAIVAQSDCFRRHAFLPDEDLRAIIGKARALILPSEIEGFGLPALEAYYLGTPVCFVQGTSVEEILLESTSLGGFRLETPESLWLALDQVSTMPAADIFRIGNELRERFASEKIVNHMLESFREIAKMS